MAEWKYIVVKVDDQKVPFIFPGTFVHEEMWKALRAPLFARTRMSDPKPVSAGFLPGLSAPASTDRSDTLKLKADPLDASLINTFPYIHGLDVSLINKTEKLVLSRTIELLQARLKALG
jgi:hypothetical protein